ncbi:PREDICTED: RRP15-like protein [Dinoponera quadriceps]|uniref:RRP15-like protein n=1 Tax=Dinoponera quadriceps TaxID=609295 RepID=A0A6P3YAN7_DINQU|nr:PREDICTED: RRP15-like protein [Dinoponera quadriceps]XP_014488055.1 PREDICTED: RRP15-like protein [Dinoponera quadriceps]XP_014488056.1 PREDICTED: RRP15-like protein [Dinoponera quadriceps]
MKLDTEDTEVEVTESVDDAKSTGNAGWADVMQKILRTKKSKKKTVVLAKAKKLCDVKETEKEKEITFEIDGVEDEDLEKINNKVEPTTQIKSKRKEKSLGIRVKPSITDREHERMLQKIATRGVVQLFNAVRQQQTVISKKLSQAGPLERKREQVLKNIDKNAFLDILMGKSESISVKSVENKDKDDKMWGVLRDDFVMGAKLKDWDKKNTEEEEEDSSAPEDMDSDD